VLKGKSLWLFGKPQEACRVPSNNSQLDQQYGYRSDEGIPIQNACRICPFPNKLHHPALEIRNFLGEKLRYRSQIRDIVALSNFGEEYTGTRALKIYLRMTLNSSNSKGLRISIPSSNGQRTKTIRGLIKRAGNFVFSKSKMDRKLLHYHNTITIS